MAMVADAMRRSFASVPADATVAEVERVAARSGARHLLVLDDDNLVGVVCRCDLEGAPPDEPVSERMTVPVFTVRPDAPLAEAVLTLRDCRIGCLPVAAGGMLLGVLTAEDVRSGHF
jgi:acetoin utilization protein AcuB